jgi:apolipoprotein N-acyltransferase
MQYFGLDYPSITTISGIMALFVLLNSSKKIWLFTGFFIGIFWFWWISLSFIYYNMPWAIPIVVLSMGLLYALLFWSVAKLSELVEKSKLHMYTSLPYATKALGLLILSYIHPFGFDWFKPELMFVNSYIGIEKWQFAIVLLALSLAIIKRNILFLTLILLSIEVNTTKIVLSSMTNSPLELVETKTSVKEKWDETKHSKIYTEVFDTIDSAIANKKTLIVFPESVFPIFLNYDKGLLDRLKEKSKYISVVVGALFWDGKTPYNSTYIFTKNSVKIANKVVLVPFGESNPLPDFLSDWVNEVFYDGAVDYQADNKVTDYVVDGVTYRNAICFEATSQRLYEKDSKNQRPKNMIVLSNNGWFTPSIEPTLQSLLLRYYSRKYKTTIYHSTNMSSSYVVKP